MERLNAFIQSLRGPPPRSFEHATRDGTWVAANDMRRRASAGDLLADSIHRSPLVPDFEMGPPQLKPKSKSAKHQVKAQPEERQSEQRVSNRPQYEHRSLESYGEAVRREAEEHRRLRKPHELNEEERQYLEEHRLQQQRDEQYYQEQLYAQQQHQYHQQQFIQEQHAQEQRLQQQQQQQQLQQQQQEALKNNNNKRKTSGFLKTLFRGSPGGPPAQDLPKDPLPQNSTKLDALCNYHLGQLDRIKRELKQFNRNIDQLKLTFQNMCRDVEMDAFDGTRFLMEERIKTSTLSRNALAKFVAFHLQELERLLVRKLELGHASSVPNL